MAKNDTTLSINTVKGIGKMASLPLTDTEARKLSKNLSDTLAFIEKVKKIDTKNFQPTSHVTGLENIFREDEIIPSLSVKDALSGARSIYNGYFKVKAVLEE